MIILKLIITMKIIIVMNKNIDTPEELHFFYINVLQNGKELEGKFEVTNSINP